MGKDKCIQCGRKDIEKEFSTDVQILDDWYRLGDLYTQHALSRKFEIFASICKSCLEKRIKTSKFLEIILGMTCMLFAGILLFIFFLKISEMAPNSMWIMIALIVVSGFGSYFSLRRYYKLPIEIRSKKEAKIIIEERKKDIVKDRDQNQLCDICGIKGYYRVSIYDCSEGELLIYNRSYKGVYNKPPSKILTFFRCKNHHPTEKEFSDIRKQSLSVDVTEI